MPSTRVSSPGPPSGLNTSARKPPSRPVNANGFARRSCAPTLRTGAASAAGMSVTAAGRANGGSSGGPAGLLSVGSAPVAPVTAAGPYGSGADGSAANGDTSGTLSGSAAASGAMGGAGTRRSRASDHMVPVHQRSCSASAGSSYHPATGRVMMSPLWRAAPSDRSRGRPPLRSTVSVERRAAAPGGPGEQ
jgi:hypothetical protein